MNNVLITTTIACETYKEAVEVTYKGVYDRDEEPLDVTAEQAAFDDAKWMLRDSFIGMKTELNWNDAYLVKQKVENL
jgi:hypothetical protein